MAKAEDLSGIHEVFRDTMVFDKTSLVLADEVADPALKPGGQYFGETLD